MISYTEQLGFDVLTTPIAEVDRRTLSQAWLSALHLGKDEEYAPPVRASKKGFETARAQVVARRLDDDRGGSLQNAVRSASVSRSGASCIDTGEIRMDRRSPTSVLARRIERALLTRTVRHGTFVLDGMEGRVHLSVRSQHGRIHIVAVCSPNAKAYVAKALQHVRFALSRKGIAFEGSLREMHGTHLNMEGEGL